MTNQNNTERQIPLFDAMPLSHYREILPNDKKVSVMLTKDEMAAILQAYDYGVDNMTEEGREQLEQVVNSLKFQIHP